jgi:signal transduction histidine kinase
VTNATRALRLPGPVTVLAIAIVIVASVGTWAYGLRVDPDEDDRYTDRLRHLVTLQHRLNEQVLRAHAGLAGSYDPLVRTTRELRDLHRELAVVPRFIAPEGRGAVLARLASSTEVLDAQQELVEHFKSENAILLNSLRFFPVAAADLAQRLAAEPGAELEASQLRDLMRDVLRIAVFPTPQAVEEVRTHLASLDPEAGPLQGEVRLLLRHADVITTRRPSVDRLLEEILAQPGEARAVDLGIVYGRQLEHSVQRAQTGVSAFLACVALAIAAIAASIVLRTRADAQVIDAKSHQLALSIDRQNRFVSMTSHEFRTPLSVIVSSAELLRAYGHKWGREQHEKHLSRIERAGRAMTDLLDGMLLIGRTDAGHRDFRPMDIELAPVVNEAVEAQRLRAKDGITIELDAEAAKGRVCADPRLLRHVLDNLVSNAVKYNKKGGKVMVHAALEDGRVAFEVRDQGIGIPAADQEKLFDTFHRARNVGSVQGTGLGLAIVKRAVDLHGGTIRVTSAENEGTTFHVAIPVGAATDAPTGGDETNGSRPARESTPSVETGGEAGASGSAPAEETRG